MLVRLTHIDGKLPNLALMKLARYHRDVGDEIYFTKSVDRGLFEKPYDRVYGSAIFTSSLARVQRFREQFPSAIVGGTHDLTNNQTVEQFLEIEDNELYDYSLYPAFEASIGFTQRGCRLKCGFCVVPKKEGKPRSVNTIAALWRGGDYPKHLHILDNDFFGQPREQWESRIAESIDGGFKICLNQGINIRLIDDTAAEALSRVPYFDDSFKTPRIYTAWDNIGDEQRFFKGVDTLERHGIPAKHVMAYMLVGYDKRETWERLLYRYDKMTARGVRPYPMVFGDRNRTLELGGCNLRVAHRTLGEFQRWVIKRYHEFIPFEEFGSPQYKDDRQLELLNAAQCL